MSPFLHGRTLRVAGVGLVLIELEFSRQLFALFRQYSDAQESLPFVARMLSQASPWAIGAMGLLAAACLGFRRRSPDGSFEYAALAAALVIIPLCTMATFLSTRGYW